MIRRILALMSKPEIIHGFTNFPASKENHMLWMYFYIDLNSTQIIAEKQDLYYSIASVL